MRLIVDSVDNNNNSDTMEVGEFISDPALVSLSGRHKMSFLLISSAIVGKIVKQVNILNDGPSNPNGSMMAVKVH